MSGRLVASSPRSRTFPKITALVLTLSATPAFAQTMADPAAPPAPAEPPVAPPAPDAPAPAPSEPAPPPSQAPQVVEPTPAPTPTPAAPTAESELKGAPAGSAAFAPLATEAAKPPPPASKPAAPAPAPPAKPPSQPVPESKDNDNPGGLLGPFRIGVLVGTGLPEVLNFGAQLKLTRFFGAGVNVGLIPQVKINYYGEAKQKYQEYDVYGHIYPFGGSFFLGAGVGYAQIDGTLATHISIPPVSPGVPPISVDVTSDAVVRTLVLTPQLGFLKIFDVGFAFGFDIGAQIPIAPSEVHFNTVAVGLPSDPTGTIDFQRDYINPNDEKVRRTLDTVGRTPLPTFNLKIGWFL